MREEKEQFEFSLWEKTCPKNFMILFNSFSNPVPIADETKWVSERLKITQSFFASLFILLPWETKRNTIVFCYFINLVSAVGNYLLTRWQTTLFTLLLKNQVMTCVLHFSVLNKRGMKSIHWFLFSHVLW